MSSDSLDSFVHILFCSFILPPLRCIMLAAALVGLIYNVAACCLHVSGRCTYQHVEPGNWLCRTFCASPRRRFPRSRSTNNCHLSNDSSRTYLYPFCNLSSPDLVQVLECFLRSPAVDRHPQWILNAMIARRCLQAAESLVGYCM